MNFLNKFIKKFQSSEKNLEQSATNNLKISPNLDEFVKKELVPGLNISSDYFWKTFEDIVERFSERNRELLNERENLQNKIDDWHIQNKDFNIEEYKNFLTDIGLFILEALTSKLKLGMLIQR